MAASEQAFYDQIIRRITWIMLAVAIAGTISVALLQGFLTGLAFLIGAGVSYVSFWGWQHIVNAIGPNPKKRSAWFFTFRIIVLGTAACVIIKFLGLNVAAAVGGLLVSAAAVILELIYELIYART